MSDAIQYCKNCETNVMCHLERKCMRQAHGLSSAAGSGWLARLVRKFTEWAWVREYYANGDVFILYFEKTERTYGGDIRTRFIFSVWSTRAEAERAEALAWNDDMHRNWTKETVATWIEHQPVQCFANTNSTNAEGNGK